MLTSKQRLVVGATVLFAVLLVAGSYFGSRWLHGPDVNPVPEHLLTAKRYAGQMNCPACASVTQDAPSMSESQLEPGQNNITHEESETLQDFLGNDESTTLADTLSSLEKDEGKNFPDVPEGFPSNIRPVWLEDFFDEILHADHVIIDRVLIELWNQGDHEIVYGVLDEDTGKVYPIYHDVVYVEWDSYVGENLNGESLEVPYISYRLGISSTVEPLLNEDGNLFTEEELMSGAYVTMHPDVTFVDYSDAGYDPATVLNDY